jgi:phosphatidylglycerophosphatase A
MNPQNDFSPAKPRVALAFATAFGLGYMPVAPGTWGSAGGVAIYWGVQKLLGASAEPYDIYFRDSYWVIAPFHVALLASLLLLIGISLIGVWAAGRAEKYFGVKDPGSVVIDEVSGQLLTYTLAAAAPNWKYLLVGFILFRVLDTWKPFPARRAELLPGGWGIMADDWVAGIYGAAGLWLARALGL